MSRYFKKYQKGFSLVELTVSIGILAVILSVVVTGQSTYTDTASVSNLADEISATLSQAQAYGIAVKELTPGSSIFSASYGLTLSLLAGGSPNSYIFFADRNTNNIYDGDWSCPVGGVSECLEKINISNGNYIEALCVLRAGETELCGSAMRADISFVRPNTTANILLFDESGQALNVPNMEGVKIMLKNPRGATRFVSVYNSGQISVQ